PEASTSESRSYPSGRRRQRTGRGEQLLAGRAHAARRGAAGLRAQLPRDPARARAQLLDAERGGDLQRHAVAEEVIEPIVLRTRELARELDEVREAVAHRRSHHFVGAA